jgi:hypothetical protein
MIRFEKIMIVSLLAGSLTSCKKWLNVTPQDKVPQVTLFTNEQGFKDALTGVYLNMDKSTSGGSNGIYTNDLSMGILSVMAYNYDNASNSAAGGSALYNAAYLYNYNDPLLKPEIGYIWSALYNNIANVNNILAQIDAAKGVFTADNYQRIKGEALGLRALFHFDAVRLFGQPPLTAGTTPAIPYVKSFTIRQTPLYTVGAVLDSCLADLAAARSLLSLTDTSAVLGATTDPFTSYTQNHLNYWAVGGLTARVYLYAGNTDSASYYAKAVIGSNKFPLITSNVAASTNVVRDHTYSQEHLFALYSQNIGAYSLSIFELQSPATPLVLNVSATGKNNPYIVPVSDNTDWRLKSWFDPIPGSTNVNTVVPSKFYQEANLPYNLQGLMPVIRVSEMYYIAAECAGTNGDVPTGVNFINPVRLARGLTALNSAGISTTDSLFHLIRNEYRKEFSQEGQTFFYYKRLNLNLNTYAGTPTILPPAVFVFPLPDAEKQYRGL